MDRYLIKFRDLKEKAIVLRKLTEKDFDDRNKQTISEFDLKKEYCVFLQDNHYFNRNAYIAMM